MRAPSLARMAAVAAPRPDAEPAIIAQKPSLAIAFPLFDFEQPRCGRGAVYHIARSIARKSNKLHCAELMQSRPTLMSGAQVALRSQALVKAAAFAHHAAQETAAYSGPGATPGGVPRSKARNAVAESENIVAETAEKIFADLADTQTINRDKKGEWKAPLWQALTEAGLPLSWVPEDCGGSGASLAEGFSVLSAAGRFVVAVPLAETMLAGWLLSQARITSPDGEMTVVPANPKDRITVNADGSLSGKARSVPFAKAAKHFAVLASDAKGS